MQKTPHNPPAIIPLAEDIQKNKTTIKEFIELSIRILDYLPAVLSGYAEKNDYLLYFSNNSNTKRSVRPIKASLFIMKSADFKEKSNFLIKILKKIRSRGKSYTDEELHVIDSVLYTIQQSIGAAFDLLVEPNSARKHVGNRFEELMKAVFTEIDVPNKRVVLKIPYESDYGEKNYTCENDLILSPKTIHEESQKTEIVLEVVNSSTNLEDEELLLSSKSTDDAKQFINPNEVVVSVKTTSKDRMGKMFMDKILLERFVGHDLKVIGIFLNDVQRKGVNNISYTLVSGLFMVYNKFIAELNGVYYLDPPPNAYKQPYNKFIKRFALLITKDIDDLLSS